MSTLTDESGVIKANNLVGCDLYLMTIELPQIAKSVQPGQFIHMKLPCFEQHILRRPFSVYARCIEHKTIDILYQTVGSGTKHMTGLNPGDVVQAIGPIGSTWRVPNNTSKALLIGGGVGAAPLFMLAETLQQQGTAFDVILGARNKDALVCVERYKELFRKHSIDETSSLMCATDDGSFGFAGVCTPLVEQVLAQHTYDYAAVCGPEPMMRAVWGLLDGAGVVSQMSFERRMACGIGACLSCVIKTRDGNQRVCVDGPIFNADEVML